MGGEETESMRLLFQAVLSTDDETYEELARLQLLSALKYFRKGLIVYLLVMAVYYLISRNLYNTLLGIAVMMMFQWSYIDVRRPKVMNKRCRAAAERLKQEASEGIFKGDTRFDFYQDTIRWENSCAKGIMEYSKIRRIDDFSRYYTVVTEEKRLLLFWKDRFISGCPDDFITFIWEKQKKTPNRN